MADSETRQRWRPTRTSLIAGGIVIAGFALTGVSWWFLLLAALGTLGPGILREMGWLSDRDEFQRQADRRAGYHAFLCVGLVAFAFVAFFRAGEREIKDLHNLPTFFLALIWFTWFLSSLLAYWGPQKTASRILYGFGSVWLAFAILSNIGSEWSGWAALLIHPLIAAPFFALGWLGTRFPRIAGGLLLAVSVFAMQFFGWFRGSNMGEVTRWVTFVLLLGPLLASGIALLAVRTGQSDDADEGDLGAGTLEV